ncbi:hypothetical protein L6452_23285 [Arctium lappa]|uniref:Uncharacterized protein n=1 Tax=Arctium lappa TaxID=4217 RepID=A0ACB9B632_ARCLA|nr:hypothetical protein L6452_23285 [Arctium lappa]
MAVGGGSGGGSSSSIALLQERFRQLQKMRERRQEMEVLKLLSKSESISQTKYYEHSETIFRQPTTTRSSLQDSLSLGLDLYGKKPVHQPSNSKSTPPFRDFWSTDSATVSAPRTIDKHDVDTSLHL